jgi:dUTP pyrophosphatase
VIDPDYDGEFKVILRNESKEAYQIKVGDRIAQVIFLPLLPVEIVSAGGQFEESESKREGGLGSTGK